MLQIEYIRVVFPPFILPKKPTKYKSLKKLMYRNPLYPGLYQTQRLVPHAIRVSIWCRAACRIRVPNLTSWGIHQVGPQAMIPLDSLTVRQYGICTRSCSTRLNFLFSTFYFLLSTMDYGVGCSSTDGCTYDIMQLDVSPLHPIGKSMDLLGMYMCLV